MFYCVVLIALAVSSAFNDRLVTGQDVAIEDFPYHVAIEVNSKYHCGGSVLSATKVLTGAGCTQGYRVEELKVRAGSALQEQGGQLVSVSHKEEHPEFNFKIGNNDVCVLTLATSLEFSDKVQPIAIASDNTSVGSTGYVTRWGQRLQGLHFAKTTDKRCLNTFYLLFDPVNTACYEVETDNRLTVGDRGCPLVVDGKLVGLVSVVYQPEEDKPALFVNLSQYKDLIESW